MARRAEGWGQRMPVEVVVLLVAVGLLDLAALRWGWDSRDGRDWQPRR